MVVFVFILICSNPNSISSVTGKYAKKRVIIVKKKSSFIDFRFKHVYFIDNKAELRLNSSKNKIARPLGIIYNYIVNTKIHRDMQISIKIINLIHHQ